MIFFLIFFFIIISCHEKKRKPIPLSSDPSSSILHDSVIRSVNSDPNIPWRAKRSRFWEGKTWDDARSRAISHESFAKIREEYARVKKYPYDSNKRDLSREMVSLPASYVVYYPNFDSSMYIDCYTPPRNQGDCGSCWIVSTIQASEDRWCIAHKERGFDVDFAGSIQEIMSCSDIENPCDGNTASVAMYYIAENGVTTESCYSYREKRESCKSSCVDDTSYSFETDRLYLSEVYRPGSNLSSRMEMMIEGGPIVVYMEVFQDFYYYGSGVYSYQFGESLGWHAVTCMGWGIDDESGTPIWYVKNSWEEDWGEDGFFRIERGINSVSIEEYAYAAVVQPCVFSCGGICDHFSTVCSSHGSCVGIDECECFTGFTGKLCRGDDSCSFECDHGYCLNGKCECDDGYNGSTCSSLACQNLCEDRGECNEENGECECYVGWSNPKGGCDVPLCVPNCIHGECYPPFGYSRRGMEDNRCICEEGWEGEDCSEPVCNPECVNGLCAKINTCVCYERWEGDLCNKCKEGYHGDNCEHVIYPGAVCYGILSENSSVCSGRGSCYELDSCKCDELVEGNNCETVTKCYNISFDDENVCFGNGDCVNWDTCKCYEGFEQPVCEYYQKTEENSVSETGLIIAVSSSSMVIFFLVVVIIFFVFFVLLFWNYKKRGAKSKHSKKMPKQKGTSKLQELL